MPESNLIFVSFAHPNLAVVRKLVHFLQTAGLKTWFDKENLLGGQEWEKEIAHAILSCSLFIVNLSSAAVDRRGVFQKEIRLALDVALTIPPNELYIMPVKLDECTIAAELTRYHVLDLFEENGPEVLLKSIEYAFKLSLRAERTAQQELENQLSKGIAPEQALGIERPLKNKNINTLGNLSGAAKALLSEILKDDRSDTKGVSFMFISETQGFYVPYLWDNHVHGALRIPMIDIATQRMAADELARRVYSIGFHAAINYNSTHLALNSFQTPNPAIQLIGYAMTAGRGRCLAALDRG
jgi:hypothetical protein